MTFAMQNYRRSKSRKLWDWEAAAAGMQSNVTLLSYCVIEGLFFAGHCKFPELRLLHLTEDRVVTVYINTSVKHPTSSMNALRLRPLINALPLCMTFMPTNISCAKIPSFALNSLCKKGLLTLLTKVQNFFSTLLSFFSIPQLTKLLAT